MFSVQQRTLRFLEIVAVKFEDEDRQILVAELGSGITPPVFPDFVIVPAYRSFCNEEFSYLTQSKYLLNLSRIKPFRLAFRSEDGDREDTVRRLKRYIDEEEAKGWASFSVWRSSSPAPERKLKR
jgi:hypothetical protein